MNKANQAASALEAMIEARNQGNKIRSGIVTAVSAGLVSIRRAGSATDEGGYARLLPGIPKVGQRVALAKMGGAELVLGVISRVAETLLDLGAPIVGQVYIETDSAAAATTTSNTSNSAYVVARSFTWSALPDGTYDILVDFSLMIADSVPGAVDMRVVMGATNSTPRTLTPPNTANAETTFRHPLLFTGVVVAGGVTIQLQYKRNTGSGTALARNPAMSFHATRKA